MRRVLASLLILFSVSAFAEVRPALPVEQCAAHVPFGQPKSKRSDTTLVCREGYLLEHDNKAHIPAWVAYVLTPQKAVGCAAREGGFKPEPSLPPGASATAKDYAKSGYDIGHMANSGDMRWSQDASDESNLFANAAPQLPGLNRAGWLELEAATRGWAVTRGNPLLVYVGPIYDTKAPMTIGPSRVTVPTAFYKVLVDTQTKEVLAFIYPHVETREPPRTFRTSLAEVQRWTGFVLPVPKGAVSPAEMWPVTSAKKTKAAACSIR